MFCAKCGSHNPDEADFCYHCGKALFRPRPPIAAVEPTPQNPTGPSPAQPLPPVPPLPITSSAANNEQLQRDFEKEVENAKKNRKTMLMILFIGGASSVILSALYGARNVSNGIRAFGVILFLLAIAVAIYNRITIAIKTKYPPSQPKIAYNAVFARTSDGRITDKYLVGLLREGKKGYTDQPDFGIFEKYEDAQNKANELNAQTGLSKWQINGIINRWA